MLVLVLDMTATAVCDHAGGDALARVYQRAIASGTELRPVVAAEGVRRVLTVSGVDCLVPVYDTLGAALAATAPGDHIAAHASGALVPPGARGPGWHQDVGTEVALLDRDGVIVSVNDAWRAFAAANGPPDGPGAAAPAGDATLVGELTGRLAAVARILEESEGQACANLAGPLRRARGELAAVIRDARTAITPRGPTPDS